MAKIYRFSYAKLCRREGMKLFFKGERCLGPKCAVERRQYPPGAHAKLRRSGNVLRTMAAAS